MEKFYDKIKDKMSSPPTVSTDWDAWNDIEDSLGKEKKRRFLPILLGIPFLLFCGGIIGYIFGKNPDKSIVSEIDIQTDTMYITEYINTTDTILKTEYITKWKLKSSNEALVMESQLQNSKMINETLQQSITRLETKLDSYRNAFSESELNDNPKYAHLDFFESINKSDVSFNNSDRLDRSIVNEIRYSPLLEFLPSFQREKIFLVHNLLLENLVKNKKSKSLLDQITPDYFNIGFSIETPGLAISKNLTPGFESGIGLNAEIIFSPKFSIVTGVRTRSTQNSTSDPLLAMNYPQPDFETDDEFKSLSIKSSFIEIPVTFKYEFLKLNQNRVYLTSGMLISKQNESEYNYEYERGQTEIYYEQKGGNIGWSLGSAIVGLGYEFDPWDKTSAFIETYARYNFKSINDPIHGIGFRFGIYYKI